MTEESADTQIFANKTKKQAVVRYDEECLVKEKKRAAAVKMCKSCSSASVTITTLEKENAARRALPSKLINKNENVAESFLPHLLRIFTLAWFAFSPDTVFPTSFYFRRTPLSGYTVTNEVLFCETATEGRSNKKLSTIM